MNIVMIGGSVWSLVFFRGQLLKRFVQAGHEVMTYAPIDKPERDAKLLADLKALGVQFQEIPLSRSSTNPFSDLRTLNIYTQLLRAQRPDLVISYTIKPVIYGSLAARLAAVPNIYAIITGLGYTFMTDSLKQKLLGQLTQRLYRLALRANKKVFFQNPDDIELFTQRGLIKRDKAVLVNGSGVDLDYYAHKPLPEKPIFLLIARLIRAKGVGVYVEAARRLKARYPDAQFQLLGPVVSNPDAFRQEEVTRWQDEGVIDYLGRTTDVRPFVAGASVHVHPSFYREGTPRTVLEAMSMGRAVITTDAPGCRETVVPGENGVLVPVKDVAALANAMEGFILEPERIARMGQKSREMAEAKYDVHKVNASMFEAMGLDLAQVTKAAVLH